MLVIRLQRRGRKGLAMYRIVVQDKRTHPTREKVIARLGSYNPHTKELKVENELAGKFLAGGAQPSDRVVRLLKTAGVKMPAWVKEPVVKARTTRNAEKLRSNQPSEAAEVKASEESEGLEEPKEEEQEAKTEEKEEVATPEEGNNEEAGSTEA
jgi:small subunit ribosomal protein S16